MEKAVCPNAALLVAVLFEDLQRKGGRGQRQAEADHHRGRQRQPEQGHPGQPEQRPGDQHLRQAKAEDLPPQRPQPRRLQLQPDEEQQEDDAEFGDVQDCLAAR